MNTVNPVLVIGAGPAGLATAAELRARHVPVTVLERGSQPGAAWAGRYDALRFNTSRRRSALPGAPFPREYGQFPTRDQYIAYLRRYAADRHLPVETGVQVTGIRSDGGGWCVNTSVGDRHAEHVVVATGALNRAKLPDWATENPFDGEVVHASVYRNPAPYAGKTVVVAGAGTSGMEIAHQLTADARKVLLAVRTPPNILLREFHGLPGDLPVPLLLRLPDALVDRMLFGLQRTTIGDLSAHGLPRPAEGAMAAIKARGVTPAIVDVETLDEIRSGAIECVPAVVGLAGGEVVLTDGRRVPADAVILATGYQTGLEELVGSLGVLDERGMPLDGTGRELAPGLRFIGFVYRPGLTGYVGTIAKRVAREIAAGSSPRSDAMA